MNTWTESGLSEAGLIGAMLALGLRSRPAVLTGSRGSVAAPTRHRAGGTGELPRYRVPEANFESEDLGGRTDGFLASGVRPLSSTPSWDAANTIGPLDRSESGSLGAGVGAEWPAAEPLPLSALDPTVLDPTVLDPASSSAVLESAVPESTALDSAVPASTALEPTPLEPTALDLPVVGLAELEPTVREPSMLELSVLDFGNFDPAILEPSAGDAAERVEAGAQHRIDSPTLGSLDNSDLFGALSRRHR